jgi:hypothetical protein
MKRIPAILLLLTLCARAGAMEPATDPSLVVVRIKSHGASGAVIATTDGKSWILSCAHMFYDARDHVDPSLTGKKIVIDGPAQPYAESKLAPVRVIGADPLCDLSLLEIDNGPFHFMPIAAAGFLPGRDIVSAGYDGMKWPITQVSVTILQTSPAWTYTREKPWHGRSGGGLFDLGGRCLIGVVNGYETTGQQRGIYVGHDAILRFVGRYKDRFPPTPGRPPEPQRHFKYSAPMFAPPFFGSPCPGGVCPIR